MYVSMIDKFMSGWGPCEGKENVFLVECDTDDQADAIVAAGVRREEMRKVRVHQSKPHYSSSQYLVSERHYDELGPVWKGESDV